MDGVMMLRLIKINEVQYTVVDETGVKTLPYKSLFFDTNSRLVGQYFQGDVDVCWRKITHSTQPLEEYEHPDGGYEFVFNKIQPLSLSEVEELVYGYSVKKMADNQLGGLPPAVGAYEAYIRGFKAHQEIVKDKNKESIQLLTNITEWCSFMEQPIIGNQAQRALDLLLPHAEWNVEFDENGKLKLI
jgi:hypothetical protein